MDPVKLQEINYGHIDYRKVHMGPILHFFDMEGVTEIMVNRYDSVFIKVNGEMVLTDVVFESESEVKTILVQVAQFDGNLCNEDSPEVNSSLWDGSRFCGLLFPWSSKGTNFTIRLFPKKRITTQDLIAFGSLTEEMTDFLKKGITTYRNILVSGSTDSGKTTLLNALASYIDKKDRLITIEDTQEINVDVPNWVSHVAHDVKGKDSKLIVKSLADLIRTTLRENPTRICVGEIRDSDSALAFMRALNTGHNGCFSSLHANDPLDAVQRMAELLGEAGKPMEFALKQVLSNLHIIVQAEEIKGVGKRVVQILEVDRNGDHQVIFYYDYVKSVHVKSDILFEDTKTYSNLKKYEQ